MGFRQPPSGVVPPARESRQLIVSLSSGRWWITVEGSKLGPYLSERDAMAAARVTAAALRLQGFRAATKIIPSTKSGQYAAAYFARKHGISVIEARAILRKAGDRRGRANELADIFKASKTDTSDS